MTTTCPADPPCPCSLQPPERTPLPAERESRTFEFDLRTGGPDEDPETHHGRLVVGFYPDGRPGEIFLRLGSSGSTMAGFCDIWGRAFSLLLQYGVPLPDLLRKFSGFTFEPAGWVDGYGFVRSAADLVVKILAKMYGVPREEPIAPSPG